MVRTVTLTLLAAREQTIFVLLPDVETLLRGETVRCAFQDEPDGEILMRPLLGGRNADEHRPAIVLHWQDSTAVFLFDGFLFDKLADELKDAGD